MKSGVRNQSASHCWMTGLLTSQSPSFRYNLQNGYNNISSRPCQKQNWTQIFRWHFSTGFLAVLLCSPLCLLVLERVVSRAALVSAATVKGNHHISVTNPAQHLSWAEERRPMAIWSDYVWMLLHHYFPIQWTRGQISASPVFRQRDRQMTSLGERAIISPGWDGFVGEGSWRGSLGLEVRMETVEASNLSPTTQLWAWTTSFSISMYHLNMEVTAIIS